MTSSFHGGMRYPLSRQLKPRSVTMLLPTELVTASAYGSFRHSSRSPLRMRYRYWSPRRAATSADHIPSPSGASGVVVGDQPLKVPATLTASAKGAQTRKEVVVPWRIAPMPGRVEGAGAPEASVMGPTPRTWVDMGNAPLEGRGTSGFR